MAGLSVRASVILTAPPERVWELLCDTSRYADWVVGTDAVTRTDGPATLGSTYDERNTFLGPWKGRTRWKVSEFDAPRRQLHTGEGLPLARSFDVIMELSPHGGGSELAIELKGEPAGPLGRLVAKGMQPPVTRNNRRTAENFRQLAEREL